MVVVERYKRWMRSWYERIHTMTSVTKLISGTRAHAHNRGHGLIMTSRVSSGRRTRVRNMTQRFLTTRRRLIQSTWVGFQGFTTESSGSPSEASFLEHVFLGRVNGPVVTLARSSQSFWKFDETFIEWQVVANRIFPALIWSPEKRKFLLKMKNSR